MPRFTFGGDITQLVTYPDTSLGGALKVAPGAPLQFYATTAGGSPVTDYLLDPGYDGTFEQAASSLVSLPTGYLPEFQGPLDVSVLYYDPNPNDADVARVRLEARDAGAAGVPAASTTVAGIVQLADATEVAADANGAPVPTASVDVVTATRLISLLQSHVNASVPHPTLGQAVTELQEGYAGKANLGGDGKVPLVELPGNDTAAASTLLLRDASGRAVAAPATDDAHLLTLGQARSLSGSGGGSTLVRYVRATPTGLTSASATTFATVPTVVVPDAESGDEWLCDYLIAYRAAAGAGIQVQHKTGAVATTNRLSNPSAESTVSPYTSYPLTTLSISTAGGAQAGTSYLLASVTGASAGQQVFSEWVPCEAGSVWSGGAQLRRGSATARTVRIDVQFADAAGTAISTLQGPNNTPGTAAWTQGKAEGGTAPAGATQVRWRAAILSVVAGDAFHFDAIQLEQAATLPPFGTTGGGATALDITGTWDGLTQTTPSVDSYTRSTFIRYPAASNRVSGHGGLGTGTDAVLRGSFACKVGGAGLTSQRIELEFAQRVTDAANPTTVVYVEATFSRVVTA